MIPQYPIDTRRSLTANIAAFTCMQAISYIAPLLTVPYLVRVLRPGAFGLLSFSQGVVLFFALVTDYGFNLSGTRAVAARRDCPLSVSRIFWCTICAKLLLTIASAAALSALVFLNPKLRATPAIFIVSFLYVIGTAVFPVWLFQGLGQVRLVAIAFGVARLLTIPALLLFVRRPEDCVAAAAIQAGVQVIAAVIALPMIWTRTAVHWYRPSLAEIGRTFRSGWPLFLSGSALYLSTSSTAVILGFVAGPLAAGYYSAAEKIIRACAAAVRPLNEALFPYIAARKTVCTPSALRAIWKSLVVTTVLSLAITLAVLAGATPLCRLILGHSFDPSIPILRCLAPLPLLFGVLSVLGTQTMVVFDMDALISRITLVAAALTFPLTAVLSDLYGAPGAAIASVTVAGAMVAASAGILQHRGLPVWQRQRVLKTPELPSVA